MSDLPAGWEALLGAGAAGTLAALYRAFKDWRESSWHRADSAVNDLERWRRNADESREWEALQHQWWRDRAGELEYLIIAHLGRDALPPLQPYPERPRFMERDDPAEKRP